MRSKYVCALCTSTSHAQHLLYTLATPMHTHNTNTPQHTHSFTHPPTHPQKHTMDVPTIISIMPSPSKSAIVGLLYIYALNTVWSVDRSRWVLHLRDRDPCVSYTTTAPATYLSICMPATSCACACVCGGVWWGRCEGVVGCVGGGVRVWWGVLGAV